MTQDNAKGGDLSADAEEEVTISLAGRRWEGFKLFLNQEQIRMFEKAGPILHVVAENGYPGVEVYEAADLDAPNRLLGVSRLQRPDDNSEKAHARDRLRSDLMASLAAMGQAFDAKDD